MAESLETQLGRALSFMRLLWAVDHGLQSASKSMSVHLGVTGPQRLVLRVLGQAHGDVSAGDLARVLHLHPSTLTGILQRLEDRGWIDRRQDPLDQRRSLFRLTSTGRKLDAVRTGTVEATVRRVLTRFSDTQLDVAAALLVSLANALLDGEARKLPSGRVRSGRAPRRVR